MQDLKHLSRDRRDSIFYRQKQNRRLNVDTADTEILSAPPEGARRRKIGRWLVVFSLLLALIPLTSLLARSLTPLRKHLPVWLGGAEPPVSRAVEPVRPRVSPFEEACGLIGSASPWQGKLAAVSAAGERFEFSIMEGLQQRVHDYFARYQVPYGVFVAIEPATGRILAMTAYSSIDSRWPRSAAFELYPMASLFKIVTASAALEAGKINPDTVVEFRGRAYSEDPRNWSASRRSRNNKMDVTNAMGKSINPVYGRLACDIAGKGPVLERARSFGFNQPLLPGIPVKQSQTTDPRSDMELMLMGCGLDHEVKVSPLHAAMIMASIANGGRMMAPSLADRVLDAGGAQKEAHVARELRQAVSPATSASLTRMLSTTVISGTSRRAFHERRARQVLGTVNIAAKTGSIDGSDPKGHYSWFAAYAPARSPRIALAALVINQDKWRIKASQVGEQALEEFFEK